MNLDNLSPEQLRKIDASLAEKVMGYAGDFAPRWDGKQWLVCDEVFSDGTRGREEPVPHYTTDPAAALSLLDEYGDCYITKLTAEDKSVTYRCGLIGWGDGEASTLPLAIVSAVCQVEGLEVGEVVGE